MYEVWTGADATALRLALGIPQGRFASRAMVSIGAVKKWVSDGTVVLADTSAAAMAEIYAAATPEQRTRFEQIRASRAVAAHAAVPDIVDIDDCPPIWSADTTAVAHDLARKDLLLDRRTASQAIVGMVVGVGLLEPLERWLRGRAGGLGGAAMSTSGMREIEQLEHAARMFREWDDQFGGGLRRKAVVGQLDEVNDLIRDSTHTAVRARLQRVLSLLSETAATMSWDSGDQQTAQGYYLLAVRSAQEADDPALCAHAMAGMARQMLTLESGTTGPERIAYRQARAADALELVRVAQDHFSDRITATMRALLHTREAWSYAQLGRPSAFHRASDKALAEFERVDVAEDPYWMHYFDAAELSGTLGGRLLELARTRPAYAGEAAEAIDKAISTRRPERWRSTALDQLGTAEARLIQGEYEEAHRLGVLALESVAQTSSDRVRRKLVEVHRRAQECGDARPVAELRELMQPLTASPA
ncbi:hypothetical protein [Nocardia rhizosphaerae]|uniref:Transcriptional regulator n=1 Tax=Nocardia rhizosphaerae TaxID=1691571 RepID=A0ABV8L308_9NOCA